MTLVCACVRRSMIEVDSIGGLLNFGIVPTVIEMELHCGWLDNCDDHKLKN